MQGLTILIPAFNEEAKLRESVCEVLKAVRKFGYKYEILIINDGSTDNTLDVAKQIALEFDFIGVINNQLNSGLGTSYKNGLEKARLSYITWVPADCSHRADSLDEAFSAIGSADMIIPVPSNPEVRSLNRRIISIIYTKIINLTSRLNIPYYNGLAIHRVDLLKSINIDSSGFGFQAEIIVKLIRNKNSSYRIVSTRIEERSYGKSKAFTVKNFLSVWLVLTKIVARRN